MVASDHRTYVYVGLAGEGDYIGEGGIVRRGDDEEQWRDISKGLLENAQVRGLAIRPDDPKIVFAGTDTGVYRSKDRGDTWEALNDTTSGHEVWSLAIHPDNPNVILAGYEPCSISRSDTTPIRMSCDRKSRRISRKGADSKNSCVFKLHRPRRVSSCFTS